MQTLTLSLQTRPVSGTLLEGTVTGIRWRSSAELRDVGTLGWVLRSGVCRSWGLVACILVEFRLCANLNSFPVPMHGVEVSQAEEAEHED